MWSRGLVLGIALLSILDRCKSETDPAVVSCRSPEPSPEETKPKCEYYMTAPFKLTAGSEAIVCTKLKSEVNVTVSVFLEYFTQKIPILSKTETFEFFECAHFKVPVIDKQLTGYFRFEAVGNNVFLSERKPTVIDVPRVACLAQREKPLVKPGETIKLRVVCFNELMKQVERNFVKVTLLDPIGSRIYQMLNPTMEHGVLSLTFSTSDLSRMGYYNIEMIDDKGQTEYTSAVVQKDELPRFNWNFNCQNTVSVLAKEVILSGTAEYVYGEAVPGSVTVRCCRSPPKYGTVANCFKGVDDLCVEFTQQLDSNGNFSKALNTNVFQLPFSGLENYISCEATLKEEGTGILVPSSCYMSITDRLAILRLDRNIIGNYYNKVDMQFLATLSDEQGNPLAGKSITVQIDRRDVKYVITDAEGKAECVIDTSSYRNPNITLTAFFNDENLCYGQDYNYYTYNPSYPYEKHVLYRQYSKSGSQIRIRPITKQLSCKQQCSIQVDHLFTENGVGKGATTVNLEYYVVAQNNIVAHGKIIVDLTQGYRGSSYIELDITTKFATGASILVLAALKNDIIADSTSLSVGVCFENEVTLSFNETTVPPGGQVFRKISAAPGSFCGLRAFDTAFNLMGYYDEFSPSQVFSSVKTYLFGLRYGDVNYKNQEPPCIDPNSEQFCNGIYVRPSSSSTDHDFNRITEELSILFFSNYIIHSPRVCGMEQPEYYPIPMFDSIRVGMAGASLAKAETITTNRIDLSDVFGFDMCYIGSDGHSTVQSTIPQKITSWQSEAFCVSTEKGIGMSIEPAFTTTFQEFFVDANVPPFVVRTETVNISIVISNYMPHSAVVKIEISDSIDYDYEVMKGEAQQCALSGQQASWEVAFTFKSIGHITIKLSGSTVKIGNTCEDPHDENLPQRIDNLQLTTLSEPDGIRREDSFSHQFSVAGTTSTVEIAVEEPNGLVEGSFVLTVHIMGDPAAVSMQYFDNLLSTPSGSCNQMQATAFAKVCIGEYFKDKGQLNEEKIKKLKDSLFLDYLNMLSCRQYDNGYGLFSESYGTDPWMTLYFLRTNFHLKRCVYVDNGIQTGNLLYLGELQNLETGCLNPGVRPPTNQKELNDYSILFTAVAAPILLELSTTFSEAGPLLEGVRKCLDNVDFGSQDTRTQSHLLNYYASFGKLNEFQNNYDYFVSEKGITNAGRLYFPNDNQYEITISGFFPNSDSGDITITATVLIAMTKYENPPQELKDAMASMSVFLSGHLSGSGAFYCAQQTAAAIEAITRFGRLINTGETNTEVSIFKDDTEVLKVTVTNDNHFVLYAKKVDPPFGDFKISATGTGSPFVQLIASYNEQISSEADSPFLVSATASNFQCTNGVARVFDIKIKLSYTGERGGTGITVVIVNSLTGFRVDSSSEVNGVGKWRSDGNKGIIFLKTVTNQPTEFTVTLSITGRVSSYKAASIIVEEIETRETGATQYVYPCY